MNGLVLEIFPGAGLLGHGFSLAGYSVVRGPDTLLGGDIRQFRVLQVRHAFEAVIGGPPCQDYSRARRVAPTGYGNEMLAEYLRIVTECAPVWWVLENVPGVPDVQIDGYTVQRFNLFASEFGVRQRRNRAIQFGYRDGLKLVLSRGESQQNLRPAAMASDLARGGGRTFADLCELQGLPRSFDLPGLSRSAKGRAVGNGVPVPVALALAEAIRDRRLTQTIRVCSCNCGRPVTGKQVSATAACRKRLERSRRAVSPLDDSHLGESQTGFVPGALTVENSPTIHSGAIHLDAV